MSSRFVVLGALLALGACSNDGSGSGSSSGTTAGTQTGETAGGETTSGTATEGTSTEGTTTEGTTTEGTTTGETTTPPLAPCESNDDCEGDGICNCVGACVEPGLPEIAACEKDINCGSGNYCDTCAQVCRPLKGLCEPCESAGECADDGACIDFASGGRFCLKACVSDVGCPAQGFRCNEVSGAEFKQCAPLSGSCATPALCQDDSECEYGAVCENGKCKPGCPSDDVCPNGFVCSGFKCTEGCSDENPCPPGQECDGEGHCKIPGGCLEPNECPEPETYCHPEEHMCTPGCLADFDCKATGKECIEGKCETKGCTANFFCAFDQVCNLASGECEQAEGPYCEKDCDPQSEASCGGKPNVCLSLQDDEGNALGDFCFVACGPDPQNPCPQGYACQEVELQDGPSKLCFRDCTYEPFKGN